MTIRRQLLKAIAESGEELHEMARNVGIQFTTLTAFVAEGETARRPSTVEKLANYLGLELVEKREEQPPEPARPKPKRNHHEQPT